jgi:predicted GIY-YIG superfamily endonuclease
MIEVQTFKERLFDSKLVRYDNPQPCERCHGTGVENWPPKGRQCLYRHFGPDGTLLYIGITNNFAKRQSSHLREALWASHISRISVTAFESRADVEAAEEQAIISEKPLMNRSVGGLLSHQAIYSGVALVDESEVFRRWLIYVKKFNELRAEMFAVQTSDD